MQIKNWSVPSLVRQVLLDVTAKESPEFAARTGVKGVDDQITDLTAGNDERTRARYTAAREELLKRARIETDPRVQQDLAILIRAADDQLTTNALNERLALPYGNVPQLVFFGEFSLLDD